MTQHIRNLSLLIFFSIFISCKKESGSKLYFLDKNIIKKENDITNNKDNSKYKVWYSDANNDENYQEIKVSISNDSIIVETKNEVICKGEILKENQSFSEYFKSEKTATEIKKKLEKEFGLDIKLNLSVIMNVYGEISEKGCQFPFNEMLIIDNHLFLFDKKYQHFLLSNTSKEVLKYNVNNSIQESEVLLPYSEKIDISNAKYEMINLNQIIGLEEFSCNEERLRYIPMPKKGKINLILVPQDCGDFPYRFYLLTIKNKKVISTLYVEGEWSESENYKEIETTNFSIDKNFNITVKTKINDNIKSEIYIIDDSGNFIK